MISFTLQPSNKGEIYVHPSCIILPHSRPVHFETEDGDSILLRSGFIAQEYKASQRRIHERRTCCFMSFCSEDGSNISVWNPDIHIKVHMMSQIMQPQREHPSFVLLFLFTVHMRWRKEVCNITYSKVIFYMPLYVVYVYLYICVKEWKGWRMPAVRKCAWVSGYLLNCFPTAFLVISLLSSSLHLQMFLAVLSLCWRVVFMMLYGERGLLS